MLRQKLVKIVHVEADRLDGRTFCGEQWADGDIQSGAWANEPEQIQRCNCEQCLLKLFMLGDSARIALARMGRVVQVVDVGEVS